MLNSKLVRVFLIILFLAVPLSAIEFITCADGHRATRNPFNNTKTNAEICGEVERVRKVSWVNPGPEFVAVFGLRPTTMVRASDGKKMVRNVGPGRQFANRAAYRAARNSYRRSFDNFGGLVELHARGKGTVYLNGETFPLSDITNLQSSRRQGNRVEQVGNELENKWGFGAPLYFLMNNVSISNHDGTNSKKTVIKVTFPDLPEADINSAQKGFNARLLFDYPDLAISSWQIRAARHCHVFFSDQIHPLTGMNMEPGDECN